MLISCIRIIYIMYVRMLISCISMYACMCVWQVRELTAEVDASQEKSDRLSRDIRSRERVVEESKGKADGMGKVSMKMFL